MIPGFPEIQGRIAGTGIAFITPRTAYTTTSPDGLGVTMVNSIAGMSIASLAKPSGQSAKTAAEGWAASLFSQQQNQSSSAVSQNTSSAFQQLSSSMQSMLLHAQEARAHAQTSLQNAASTTQQTLAGQFAQSLASQPPVVASATGTATSTLLSGI